MLRSILRSTFVCVALLTSTGCQRQHEQVASSPPAGAGPCTVSITSAAAVAPPPLGGAPDVARLVAHVQPAVINVTTTQEVARPRLPEGLEDLLPFLAPPSDRRGAPRGDESRMRRQALGSGFIVDPRGYAVTNAHVVEGATRVRVRLADERELPAKVKGRDERLDIALLEIEDAKDLPAITLGSSEALRVGDYVIAIGNPFGLGNTVTMGIVSAKSRAIGAGPYDDFIQTDASINPGNSGGPLFNTRGEVVGINSAISATGQGIGFASPIDALKEVLPQLVATGHVERGRLGVLIQSVDPAMAKAFGLDRPRGALIGDVQPGGPAAKAGILAGDVVVSVDGTEIVHSQDLPRLVARHPPGASVKVEVLRDKSKRTFSVVIDALPKDDDAEDRAREGPSSSAPSAAPGSNLGLDLQDSAREGVLVRRVRPGSPADGVVEPGDVVLEIDRKPVHRASEAARVLRGARSAPVILRLKREGVSRYVTLEP
jgi:serine protease Do